MTFSDLIVILVLGSIIFCIVFYLVKSRKNGGCSGCCSCCSKTCEKDGDEKNCLKSVDK